MTILQKFTSEIWINQFQKISTEDQSFIQISLKLPFLLLALTPLVLKSITPVNRGRILKIAALLLIILGLITLLRGSDWMHSLHQATGMMDHSGHEMSHESMDHNTQPHDEMSHESMEHNTEPNDEMSHENMQH